MSQSLHERMMKAHGGGGDDHAMQKAAYTIALKAKKEIAKGTMAFTFERPSDMQFMPGQHIRMTLIDPPETDDEGDSRFFSLASTPQDSDLVIAMRMRDTAFKRVLARLPIGEKVLIQIRLHSHEKAFTLEKDSASPVVFLVGGIGIVPAYSIIKDWVERKLKHKIILFYSNRRPEDAPFLGELQQIAKRSPAFTMVATMTEPQKSGKQWQGETGRIDQAMLNKYVPDTNKPTYYIAGLSDLVKSMQQILASAGVSQENIRAEEYAGFTMAHAEGAKKRSKVFVAVIGLLVVAMITVHIALASSVGTSISSIKGPLLYAVLLGIALVIAVKLKLLSGFIKTRRK